MKQLLSTIIFLFISLLTYAQRDVTVLNGYKYIYLAPLTYKNGSSDRLGFRSKVKERLENCGFKIIETTTAPNGVDACLITSCFIDHTDNGYQATSDYVYIKFFNCENQVIYSNQGETGSVVLTIQQGWNKALREAISDFKNYKYKYDESKTIPFQFEKAIPTLELTGWSEDSIRTYLKSNNLDPIEGIFKSYQSEQLSYYKFGIIKQGTKFKAIIIESDLKYWKPSELKAIFEQSSMKGLYSVKWFMVDKTPFETFGLLENEGLLSIEFKDQNTGIKRQDKFIKMFPISSISNPFKKDNSKASGSGFFLTTGGIVATNSHVIESASNIEVTVTNEVGSFIYKAKILLVDSKNDVALLQIDDEKFKGLNTIPYGIIENSDVGTKVFTIGYPLNDLMGSNYKVTDGIISSKTGIGDDVRYYQITVPLQPGNSGGPLFDKEGNVIGITSARLNSNIVGTQVENVNYAIKSSYLLNLYNMLPNPTKLSFSSQIATKELQDQIKVLKNYVCLIKVF